MEASLSDWKEFLASAVYKDIQEEIAERKALIVPKLIAGNDPVWSDECMRGRIDELEFVSSIPTDIVAALEMEENKGPKGKPNFMQQLFKNLNPGD